MSENNQLNKSEELKVQLTLVNEHVLFEAKTDQECPVMIDYTPPLGDNLGFTSLELLLMSLASCMGTAVLTFLRRMHKEIQSLSIQAKGNRRSEHPTCFKNIHVHLVIKSEHLAEEEVVKVIKMAEETYCPVYAMVKGNVEILTDFEIE